MIPRSHSLLGVLLAWSRVCGASINNELPFTFPSGYQPQHFELKLDKSFVEMTVQKVKAYRSTPGLSDDWDMEGPPQDILKDIANHWSNKYEWESVEKQLNEDYDHFATTVVGSGNYSGQPISLHFVHQVSSQENAIPLLLLHGWPSTFLEWAKVMKPLVDDEDQPFHLVAPDIPGFGFSPAPKKAGLGPRELSHAFHELMQQLGYAKYGIVTTDLGWLTGMWMVSEMEENIIGHFTDFFIASPTGEDIARIQGGSASAEESAYAGAVQHWFSNHWAYATIHAQKPLALGQALADTPVGFLGWYWDVNKATSDGYVYSYDQLITDAMMLWIPGVYANIRAYLEFFKPDVMNFPSSKVPTGVTEWGWSAGPFPKIANFAFAPENWIKRVSNLVYFRRHDSGGHFPAISEPHQWVQDVREFFYSLEQDKPSEKDEL